MADIRQIIAEAANRYGVNPDAMTAIAKIESGFNPSAQNPNSSAGGLFQQIDSNARAYGVSDRFDPVQSAEGAARFAQENTRTLRNVLGRDPSAGELYLAHQQGPGGASRLLRNPNARAADVVGADAVRLNGGTLDMTAGEFANIWINKAERALGQVSGGAGDTQLTGQQGGDTIAAPTVTPSQAANVYQAYISGQMSDEQAAAYQADVAAGRMIVPEGVTLEAPAAEPAQVAAPIVNLDPSVVANVYNAYASGQMSPEQAAAYTSDVQSGIMQLPEGADA